MTQRNAGAGRAACAGSSAFAQTGPETRAALDSMCRVRRLGAGQMLAHAHEATGFVGCVLSGVLRLQKTLADGRVHIVGLLVEGDMFGREFDGSAGFSIEAATEVEFCAFPRAAFEALLLRAPDLERAVLLAVTTETERARDWLILLSHQRIAGRVAGFLLLMCSRFRDVDHFLTPGPQGMEVRIPIGRTDLAHLLGTRTESISRALHALAGQGCIQLIDPARIVIRDRAALAEIAGMDGTEAAARDDPPPRARRPP